MKFRLDDYKVSVVIPIYNTAKLLPRCLESVLNQTHKNLEIILIDDGSTDNSYEICEKQTTDSRILAFKQSNKGAAFARNFGLNIASGCAVHFLDSDDYISKNFYEILLKNMLIDDLDIVGSRYYNEKTHYANDDEQQIVHQGLLGKLSCNEGLLKGAAFFIFKKAFLDEYKLTFDTSLMYGEDTLFVTQALFYARKVAVNLQAYYYYCYNISSTTNSLRMLNKLKVIREQQLLVGELLDEFALKIMNTPPPLWQRHKENNFKKQEKFCEDLVLEKDCIEEVSVKAKMNSRFLKFCVKLYAGLVTNKEKRRQIRDILLQGEP